MLKPYFLCVYVYSMFDRGTVSLYALIYYLFADFAHLLLNIHHICDVSLGWFLVELWLIMITIGNRVGMFDRRSLKRSLADDAPAVRGLTVIKFLGIYFVVKPCLIFVNASLMSYVIKHI